MAILSILAHQDDEIAMAWRIRRHARSGHQLFCCFLTNGARNRTRPEIRDAESRKVLERLGVPPGAIFFIGTGLQIADGSLFRNLDRAYELLEEIARSMALDEILCLSWEGGHPDHDASHLIALALAKHRGLLANVRHFPIYNGEGTRDGFFRVMSPITGQPAERRRIALSDGLNVVSLCFEYRSQRRSWLGLLPGVFLRLVVRRQEISGRPGLEKVLQPPHGGTLFYERRYGVSYREFQGATDDFIRRRIVPGSGG